MTIVTSSPGLVVPTDEQLLGRHATGDRASLELLFLRYRSVAYRVAYRLLGNEADALDAVQESFIKVLSNLDHFQRRSSFKTWLLRIVSNAALDIGRTRGRREIVTQQAIYQEAQHERSCSEPSAEVERADLRRLLDEALATLPEPQRKTFVLHVDGELSYREVAEVLGISIGTVMSRLYYARQKLRGYLAQRMKL
jgi:RNA polymerase sigma-70 factor (ECF subfamily)